VNMGLMTRFREYAATLRFPKLFMLTAVLLLVDVLVPDMIPFADEILLALATALLASFKKRRSSGGGKGGSGSAGP
jgi:hypothetical protein